MAELSRRALLLAPGPDRAVLGAVLAHADEVVVLVPAHSAYRDPACDRVAVRRYATDADAVALARREHAEGGLDLVLAMWEGAVELAATIAEVLGLPGNPPGAVRASRDKALASALFDAAGVAHPRTRVRDARRPDETGVDYDHGYPVVVKLPRSTNSQSVTLARSRAEFRAAVDDIARLYDEPGEANRLSALYRTATGEKPYLVQTYVDGPEFNIDLLYDEDDHRVVGIFEKFPMHGPAFAEVQSVYPPALTDRQVHDAVTTSVAAVRALGATRGAAHVELRLTARGPVVIEAALRLGGFLTPMAIERLTGIDPVYALAVLSGSGTLPPAVDPMPAGRACLYGAVNVDERGRIASVAGQDTIAGTPGVTFFELLKKPGDPIVPLPAGTDYHVARFLLEGDARDEVELTAERIRAQLVVELE